MYCDRVLTDGDIRQLRDETSRYKDRKGRELCG